MSGVRVIQGVPVLPLDGLWRHLDGVPPEDKIAAALEYAGCEFHDEENHFIKSPSIALVGLGGAPIAHEVDNDSEITERIGRSVEGARVLMSTSAAFSYLNAGELAPADLYDRVVSLGHFSIAHTVQVNFIVAGISEGTELELSLQRDLVHLSKVTNARTKIQNSPPLVLRNPANLDKARRLREMAAELASEERKSGDGSRADQLESANQWYPVNKATLLMLSGDLSNFKKLTALRHDDGKERELREVIGALYAQLHILWPEIMADKE